MVDRKGSDNSKQTKFSPTYQLLRDPYVQIKIIEAKDVYLSQGKTPELGDLYCVVAYSNFEAQKTK